MFVLIGLITLLISFIILIFTLHYSVVNWEHHKILSLSRKSRANNKNSSDILFESYKSQQHGNAFIQNVNIDNYKTMKNILNSKLRSLQANLFNYTKNFFSNLIEISKPVKLSSAEYIDNSEAVVDETKIENAYQHNPTFQYPKISKNASLISQTAPINKPNIQSEATIGLVAKPTADPKSEEEGLFIKLENRLLEKLKQSGMSNYDLWLELGDLYHKYDDNKKAMEIYALVSKHSKDDKQRQFAINKQIGI